MKTLETEFTKKSWSHKQIKREGNLAIYERGKEGVMPHYEAIRIKSHNGFPLPTGEHTGPAEYYPGDEAWGVDGFTFPTLSQAEAKLVEMAAPKK